MSAPAVLETPRALLTALLSGSLPSDVRVVPYARTIDPPSESTVMVRIDKVRPSKATGYANEYDFALVLVGALTTPDGAADDELDALLEDVLYAISQPGNGVAFIEATRAVYAETNPAYEVAVQVTFTKEG